MLAILRSKHFIAKREAQLVQLVEEEEEFLNNLLELMYIKAHKDERYKKLITNFSATYVFENLQSKESQKEGYRVVNFHNGKLKISQKGIENPTVKITFKNERELYKFLLGADEECQEAIAHEEVKYRGNKNYIRRFTFMAKTALENSW